MPRPKQKISIFSLAKEFGVSAPTISKALSNSNEVSEELRSKVRARADELGFKPTRPRRKTSNICVVIDLAESSNFKLSGFVEAILEGVYECCQQYGAEFSIYAHSTEQLESTSLTRELHARNTDGVVIIGANAERGYLDDLKRNQMSFMCVFDGPVGRTVTVDNRSVGRLAFEHLSKLGHTKIAFARQLNRRSASVDRYTSFMEAADTSGLPREDIHVLTPPGRVARHEWGRSIVENWVSQGRPWTAVFCLSENVAAGVLSEAAERGLRIPQDISVLTCDNLDVCREAAPPLSVIDIPNRRAGFVAAEQVWAMLAGSKAKHDIDVSPENWHLPVERLIPRRSTAVI